MTDHAGELFGKLLCIEVNLVVSDNVGPDEPAGSFTADRLIDELTVAYRAYLDEHVPPLDAEWRAWVTSGEAASTVGELPGRLRHLVRDGALPSGLEPDTSADRLARAGRDAALAEEIGRALAAAGRPVDRGVVNVLRRIRGNVEQLNGARGGERTRIARKAWELGTDTIVAQTVVQLDADTIQRVDTSMLTAVTLRDLHQRAVIGATRQWRELVELFAYVAVGTVGIVRSLFGGRQQLRSWWTRRREIIGLSERSRWQLWKPSEIVESWRTVQRTLKDLLTAGGATITTPQDEGVRPYARTVVQADGDSVWFVARHAIGRRSDLDAHAEAVSGWYAEKRRGAATLQRYVNGVRATMAALVALIGVVNGFLRQDWIPIMAGIALSIVVVPLLSFTVGMIVRRRIRALLT